MFKLEKTYPSPYIPLHMDVDGRVDDVLLVVDQFPSQEFNKGFNGFPANDITLLARAQSAKDYELILARLRENPLPKVNNRGKSDKQIISEIIPEWVQTPAEIDRFMDWWNINHPSEPLFDPVENDPQRDVKEPPNVSTESSVIE